MKRNETICHWQPQPAFMSRWTTECNNKFEAEKSSEIGSWDFCPFCGGELWEDDMETSNEDLAYELAAGK